MYIWLYMYTYTELRVGIHIYCPRNQRKNLDPAFISIRFELYRQPWLSCLFFSFFFHVKRDIPHWPAHCYCFSGFFSFPFFWVGLVFSFYIKHQAWSCGVYINFVKKLEIVRWKIMEWCSLCPLLFDLIYFVCNPQIGNLGNQIICSSIYFGAFLIIGSRENFKTCKKQNTCNPMTQNTLAQRHAIFSE